MSYHPVGFFFRQLAEKK